MNSGKSGKMKEASANFKQIKLLILSFNLIVKLGVINYIINDLYSLLYCRDFVAGRSSWSDFVYWYRGEL